MPKVSPKMSLRGPQEAHIGPQDGPKIGPEGMSSLAQALPFSTSIFESLLGPIFDPSLAHLGPILGPSWAHLGPSWAHLGPSWAHLGPSWAHFGPAWGHLGPVLGHLGPTWGISSVERGIFGHKLAMLKPLPLILRCIVRYPRPSSPNAAWRNARSD